MNCRPIIFIILSVFLTVFEAQAQLPGVLNRLPRGGGGGGGGGDSLKRRDKFEDSITLRFRYLDSTRTYTMDSSLNDFTLRFPIPATHLHLGNTGSATRSLLFSPVTRSGWDPGLHAFDVYKFTVSKARFYNTTRPYTELGYLLGSKAQQMIDLIHTQNLRPYWNAAFNYRLINSPGFFKDQKTNHRNFQLTSWYESPKKRYNNYAVLISNNILAGENGGIKRDSIDYFNNPNYRDRFTVPTKIGYDVGYSANFFGGSGSNIPTANKYREFTAMMRQQYDFGQKDSIVSDSVVIPLFYPRLRFENTLRFSKYNYRFEDVLSSGKRRSDATDFFRNEYGLTQVNDSTSLIVADRWQEINSNFSIYQFPDAKNLHQFIKVGIEGQLLKGEFISKNNTETFYNVIGSGEYRNRSRNQKWDILAFGNLHLNGYNAGDYHAYISLQRLLSKKIGSLQVGFENINRSPSFIYDQNSSFYLDNTPRSFLKENTTHFFASSTIPALKTRLAADYYLISNYLYLKDYYKLQQENSLFNVLRLSASKTFKLSRFWNWYADVYLQQKTGNVEVNMPLLFTRNRLAFEGNFFKNLFISTGMELRYHTPYKADGYSPVLGQFFYQDSVTISNWPEVSAFMHFRIRSFKAYLRAENLNTVRFNNGEFGFTNNNFVAPDYMNPGLVIRFGIFWSFVN